MRHGLTRLGSLIALGAVAVLVASGPAGAGSVVIPGSPVVLAAPPAAPPPVVIQQRLRLARPVVPPVAPVIVVPPTLTAPSGLVTQRIVIRQGHRLFLV